MYKDHPSDYVMELLEGTMWPGDALGRPLTGSIRNVMRFKRSDLVRFREENYHPANMSVIAAGKVKTRTLQYLGTSPEVPAKFQYMLEPSRARRGQRQLRMWPDQPSKA